MEFSPLELDVSRKVGNKRTEGRQCLELGDGYVGLSNFEEAMECYEQYLSICKELEDRAGEGIAYRKLGNAYNSVGKLNKAKEFYKLQLSAAKEVGDKVEEGQAFSSLGSVYQCLGDYTRGVECHERHLVIATELGDRWGEGRAYCNLGNICHIRGDLQRARDYYGKHISIVRELGNRNEEGKAFGNLGQVYHDEREFQKAIEYHKKQLDIAKEEGMKADEARAYYELGRNLDSLDSLTEAVQCYTLSAQLFHEIRDHLPSKQTSVFKDEWMINLSDVYQCVHTALCRTLLKLNMDLEALLVVESGRAQALVDILGSRFGKDLAQLRSSSQGATIPDAFKYISSKTIVLGLDADKINIWLLLPGQTEQGAKCVRKSVEGSAHLETFWKVMSRMEGTRSCVVRISEEDDDEGLLSTNVEEFSSQMRFLFDFIFDPIIADLVQGDELVIVPDGPLYLVPFAALKGPSMEYLYESFRIRVVPSLTSMKLIADSPQGYHCNSGALLVGDPLVPPFRSSDGSLINLLRLPGARDEVEMIGRLTNNTILTGEEATKTKVLQQLNSVGLVHIAAHGRADAGEIALAPSRKGTSLALTEEECMLTMTELVNVKVRARLVVLSCCHSGKGQVKAEGIVGIARGFLAAGARSVLVALWAIEDMATLTFMENFYQHLVSGSTASEALNRAMDYLRTSGYPDPKQWAPFVLIGDDVTLEFPERKFKSCSVSSEHDFQ